MVRDELIEEFANDLASSQPTPGGGGASAVSGVLGCSLGLMVCNLTIGKKKYAAFEEDLKKDAEFLKTLSESFYELADKDEEVFRPLAKGYKMPRDTEEEKRVRDIYMEQALYDASQVPLLVMENALAGLKVLADISDKGSTLSISDCGVGGDFLETALRGGRMNVRINVKSMKNEERKKAIWDKAENLLREALPLIEKIRTTVEGRL